MGIMLYMFSMILFMNKSYFYINQFMYLLLFMVVLTSGYEFFFCKITYFMGLDVFSYNLILMGLLIVSFMVISMVNSYMIGYFLFINLFLMFFLYIIFSSMNFFYMYISFEFVLVPLLILIFGWGYQPERLIAGMYLFFYTLLVSLPLMMLLLYLYMVNGSMFFDYMLYNSYFFIIHFIMLIVFMVKMPMFLVHFWLPKAHVQSPVSGSMILASLMLKIGGYGLIRICYMFEYLYLNYSYIWYSLSLMGSILIGMICLVQGDIKCMIAYSSICHMGLVVMGLMTMSMWGIMGSLMLMLGHGYCSSCLFYMANLFYVRTSSRSFFINKGLIFYIPSSSMFLFILCSFNMSCPPSLNFISEFMILMSMLSFWGLSSLYFLFISFICACFSYYMYSYTQHGLYMSLYSFSYMTVLENLCLFMHLIPLVFYPLLLIDLL